MRYVLMPIMILALGCSKAQLPTAPEPETRLSVKAIGADGIRIDSARVFLDGDFAGFTPFSTEDIEPGLHSLRVMKDRFQLFTQQLSVERGQRYNVEAVLQLLPPGEGELVVTTNEDSALVKVTDPNNSVVAQSQGQAVSYLLRPGPYIVLAEKDGLLPVFKAVRVFAGKSVTVNLEFRFDGVPPHLEFSIADDTVRIDEAIDLRWESDGYQVIIDQGVGVRGPNGSEKILCPSTGKKMFTATAYAENGMITEKRDSVVVLPPQVQLDFSVVPDSVTFGDPAIIQWHSDGHQVVIDQGVGVRGPTGTEEVYFRNPGKKVFSATAYGPENHFTIQRDSVYIKEAPDPILPIVVLSTTRVVTVGKPATITWFAQNAEYVVVDYLPNAGHEGSEQVTFQSTGIRIVTATAFNDAGFASASDTIEVVAPEVETVEDIIASADASVRADRGEAGFAATSAATIEVLTAGRYEIKTKVWYNSGESQRNESFYLELRDEAGHLRLPLDPNAGAHKVIPDEPGEPHTAWRQSGTFELDAGTYHVDIYHYAKLAEIHPEHLNGPIDGPESVKIRGFELVYVND